MDQLRKEERRPVAIHAAKGMTRAEYEDAADFMASLGVECPHPASLTRGAIIGAAMVTAVVNKHPSPWFFGPRGLLLADQTEVGPIPASGALGYFKWQRSAGSIATPLPWMMAWPGERQRTLSAHAARPAPQPSADLFSPPSDDPPSFLRRRDPATGKYPDGTF